MGGRVLVLLVVGIGSACAGGAAFLLGAVSVDVLAGWVLLIVASLLSVGWLARLGERFACGAARDGVRVGAPADEAGIGCLLPQPGPGVGHPQKFALVISGCTGEARNPQDPHLRAITVADTQTAIGWIVENEEFFSAVFLDVPGLGLGPCRAFRRDLRDLGLLIPVVLASSPSTHGPRAAFADFGPVFLIAVSGEKRPLGIEPAAMLQKMAQESGSPGEDRPRPGKDWMPRVINGGRESDG